MITIAYTPAAATKPTIGGIWIGMARRTSPTEIRSRRTIRLPTRLKELFRKGGAWWRFFENYKHRMRPAIVDNVLKMLSCGLT